LSSAVSRFEVNPASFVKHEARRCGLRLVAVRKLDFGIVAELLMAHRCVLRDLFGSVLGLLLEGSSQEAAAATVRLGRAREALRLLSISLDALVELSCLPISSSIPLGIERARAPAPAAPAVVAAESALVAFWIRTSFLPSTIPSIQSETTIQL
jgi:hypothetical protein